VVKKKLSPAKVIILTGSIGNRSFAHYTKQRLMEYCNLHNYQLAFFNESVEWFRMYWFRVPLIYALLNNQNTKFDYIVWFDDDIYITNLNVSIEHIVKQAPSKASLIIGEDTDYGKYNKIMLLNSGLYIVKNDAIMKNFFF